MSETNAELVRRAIRDVELFWSLLDEHVVWALRDPRVPDLDPFYVGRDAVVEASRRWWGTWTDYELDVDELVDGGSRVVVALRERGRGKGSGAPFDRQFAQVWIFYRGLIIRWEVFPDTKAALEAAGLGRD